MSQVWVGLAVVGLTLLGYAFYVGSAIVSFVDEARRDW